jgi:CO/xanthine dehydrogenase Mo-binding subunit
MTNISRSVSRRGFVQGAGALVVSFTLPLAGRRDAIAAPEMPEDAKWDPAQQIELTPQLDGWLRVDEDGRVTLYTGRVEIGNGILTALAQIVAEELDVPFEQIDVLSGDTDVVPNQGITSATTTIGVAAVAIRQAAATARQTVLELAAEQLAVEPADLEIVDGVISVADDPSTSTTYGEVVGGKQFATDVNPDVQVKAPADYQVVGQPVARIDIPAKLTGADGDFNENARVEGMTHARILRAPAYGAKLVSYDESVADMAGIVKVIVIEHPGDERLARVERLETMDGDWIAVVADREDQALAAVEALARTAKWEGGGELPANHETVYDWVLANNEPVELVPNGDPTATPPSFDELYSEYKARGSQAQFTLTGTYRGPYLCYGPISPAWSLADVQGDKATVWSATQWPFGARWMVAQALGYDTNDQVHLLGGSSSGLYGRRDDYDQEVDVEATILSQEVGRPVRLQWSRSDEFVWGQYRPPQILVLEAHVSDENRIDGLYGGVHTAVRGVHPLPGIATMALGDTPYQVGPLPLEVFDAGPLLRTGYMRNVFSGYNMFALESFVDEIAAKVEQDPVEFRLAHLEDQRAIDVINAATDAAGWSPSGGSGGSGMGMSFVLYTGQAGPSSAYMCYIAEVDVDEASGEVRVRKVTAAIDAGLVINPDGLKNQVEGGVIQGMSWCMKEQVTFDNSIVTSHDWATYPILTFPEIPEIAVVIVDRPDEPAKGIGEPVTVPISSAIANAIHDAVGVRLREGPFTSKRVLAALQQKA